MGYKKLSRLCGGLNIPKPFHLKTFQTLQKSVTNSVVHAADECMVEAGKKVRDYYLKMEPTIWNETDPIDICVTYDGTWHKRGHSSHHGVGVIIDLATGLIIDYVMAAQ